ncbi:MAG: hypothetical protein JWR38_1676 [Mucilaginibacter sp.]|nr:hypothetical protein [Mucilaginibacter sp.]
MPILLRVRCVSGLLNAAQLSIRCYCFRDILLYIKDFSSPIVTTGIVIVGHLVSRNGTIINQFPIVRYLLTKLQGAKKFR